MRIQMQVWNDSLKIHEIKFVHIDEVKPIKKTKRFRGKNKISNFKDKQRVKQEDKKAITNWQYSTQITHRARFGTDPLLKYINNWV